MKYLSSLLLVVMLAGCAPPQPDYSAIGAGDNRIELEKRGAVRMK